MIRRMSRKRFLLLCSCSMILFLMGLYLMRMFFSESRSVRGSGKRWKYIGNVHRMQNGIKATDESKKLRILYFSDTHQRHFDHAEFPEGDVLFYAGDFSTKGDVGEILNFNDWMMKFRYPVKLVISGNHDFSPPKKLDRVFSNEELEKMLTCCTYIHEREVILNPGNIKVYGTSFMANMWKWLDDRKDFVSYDNKYYFQTEEKLVDTYSRIPKDIDILLSHTPPEGILDLDPPFNKGSTTLRYYVDKVLTDLTLHLFGHIHCQNGYERKNIVNDREVLFVNGAIAPPGTVGWRTDSLIYTFDYYY